MCPLKCKKSSILKNIERYRNLYSLPFVINRLQINHAVTLVELFVLRDSEMSYTSELM